MASPPLSKGGGSAAGGTSSSVDCCSHSEDSTSASAHDCASLEEVTEQEEEGSVGDPFAADDSDGLASAAVLFSSDAEYMNTRNKTTVGGFDNFPRNLK